MGAVFFALSGFKVGFEADFETAGARGRRAVSKEILRSAAGNVDSPYVTPPQAAGGSDLRSPLHGGEVARQLPAWQKYSRKLGGVPGVFPKGA